MRKNIIGKPYNLFLSPQDRANFELIAEDGGFKTLATAVRLAGKEKADFIRQRQKLERLQRLQEDGHDGTT